MTVRELRRSFLLRARRLRLAAYDYDALGVGCRNTTYWRQAGFYRQVARELREVS